MLENKWDDILGEDEIDGNSPLGGVPALKYETQDPDGDYNFLAITLNHPRTPKFLQADSRLQKHIYCKLWANMCNVLGMHMRKQIVFEHCKTGQIHLHGYIEVPIGASIPGAISDVVKAYLNQLPKRHMKFKENCYFSQYDQDRYCDAPICCAYRECILPINDKGSTAYWRKYMQKDQ